MNVCGACERIQKSPISLSYRWFIRQSIAIYMLALPWGLMQSFGWWTVPTVAMLAYFMIGVEMIAEAVEDHEDQGTRAFRIRGGHTGGIARISMR